MSETAYRHRVDELFSRLDAAFARPSRCSARRRWWPTTPTANGPPSVSRNTPMRRRSGKPDLPAIGGRLLAFNYTSIFLDESERKRIHEQFIVNHYLKQFNEETIQPKQQHTCGEPCSAVCKKMREEYKKDYEPYQTMGPLCGIFDQRAAEKLNHRCDTLGFDAISGNA